MDLDQGDDAAGSVQLPPSIHSELQCSSTDGHKRIHKDDVDMNSDVSSELPDLPDSDLGEPEDDEIDMISPGEAPPSSTVKTRSAKRDLSGSEVDEPLSADDDYLPHSKKPSKPAKKKAKTSKSTTKAKAVHEKDAKKKDKNKKDNKKKEKGKLKTKAKKKIVDPDTEDDESEEAPKKKKGLVAKAVEWDDIPDWGDRKDSLLLRLPVEVLDLCFGLNNGLTVRDYLALAGVSRYFREKLTEAVFQEIIYEKNPFLLCGYRSPPHSTPEKKGLANHIFSQKHRIEYTPIEPEKYPYPPPAHYVPSGMRKDWSEAQYTIYKEEQAKWREHQKTEAKERQKKATAEANYSRSRKGSYLRHKGKNRSILGTVAGLLNGQSPAGPAHDNGTTPSGLPEEVLDQATESEEEGLPPVPIKGDRSTGRGKTRKWQVPETDDEQQILLSPLKRDPKTGDRIIHDYWPNSWRKDAAAALWHSRISKSTAMATYKVTEAQVICLKHVLIANTMGGKQYISAAVEALAYRAHGGPLGHKTHLQQRKIKADKAARDRREKIARAKADGTFIKKYKKHHFPAWSYWRREYGQYCGIHCDCGDWDSDEDPLVYKSNPFGPP
ncbi:hypothetical protein IAU59_001041 [Kwoniella sp. CBS 9459]